MGIRCGAVGTVISVWVPYMRLYSTRYLRSHVRKNAFARGVDRNMSTPPCT